MFWLNCILYDRNIICFHSAKFICFRSFKLFLLFSFYVYIFLSPSIHLCDCSGGAALHVLRRVPQGMVGCISPETLPVHAHRGLQKGREISRAQGVPVSRPLWVVCLLRVLSLSFSFSLSILGPSIQKKMTQVATLFYSLENLFTVHVLPIVDLAFLE